MAAIVVVKGYEIIVSIRPVDERGLPCATIGNGRTVCEPEELGLLSVDAEAFSRRVLVPAAAAAWAHVETGES